LATNGTGARRVTSDAGAGVARDDGDVILGWLTRIVAGIAIVAVVGFDALSIGVAHVSAVDDADSAAVAASAAWHANPTTLAPALQAAEGSAAEHGETVVPQSLQVAADGTVHLKLERDATTLLVKHLSPLKSWANVVVKGSGRYTSP
jgi:hypothetical protein